MAKIACCHNCVYAYWDRDHTLWCMSVGMMNWPACANHPESGGRMQKAPEGGLCRNYRAKPETPEGEVRQIPLGNGYYAYVDAADYEWLSQWTWHLRSGYAVRWERKRTKRVIYMHREIMQPPEGMFVDHKNRNRLDNTRENLRSATRQENMRNASKTHGTSSRFRGVTYCPECGKWRARIGIEGRNISLGIFTDEAQAARAYDRAAVEYFGEFARLNFPEEWPAERRQEIHARRDASHESAGATHASPVEGKGKRAPGKRRRAGMKR